MDSRTPEGMEKRGVVEEGYTPPIRNARTTSPGSKTAAGDDLENDLMKRLADKAAELAKE